MKHEEGVGFPIPFPAVDTGLARIELGPDGADSVATRHAIERGRHLVETRYRCADCHGKGFSGRVMIDVPLIGRLFGPNLTAGRGSATGGYTAGDWFRRCRLVPWANNSSRPEGSRPRTTGRPRWGPHRRPGPELVSAANLTSHPDGLREWTVAPLAAAMREGIRPDGTRLRTPMAELITCTAGMSDVEIEALWAYLRSLPIRPGGE